MNKIFVSTLIFGLLLLFYLVPSPSFEVEIGEKDSKKELQNIVYLLFRLSKERQARLPRG